MDTLIIVVAWIVWYIERRQVRASGSPDDLVTERCHYCRHSLAATDVRCPKCSKLTRFGLGIRLQTAWPVEPVPVRVPEQSENWAFVFIADYLLEASLFQQLLEARGVASRIEMNAKSFLLTGSYMPVNEVQELHVPRQDLERCRDFIRELLQADVSTGDAHIASGEDLEDLRVVT